LKKLLITGFNPFDERNYNTSSEVLNLLPGTIHNFVLVKKIIPVEWEKGQEVLAAHCEQEKPDAIFSMGMSKNDFLQFEILARNHRKTELTDNCNKTPASAAICPSEPETLPCTWPLPPQLPFTFSNQLRMESSDDAGGYLCNQTFFLGTVYGSACSPTIPVAFVHIPPKPQDGGVPLSDIAESIRQIISTSS
jgi:pyroglutamyl-peptidase